MFKEKLGQWKERYLTGNITLSKMDFGLIMVVCLLTGILLGLIKALWVQKTDLRCYKGHYICDQTAKEDTV